MIGAILLKAHGLPKVTFNLILKIIYGSCLKVIYVVYKAAFATLETLPKLCQCDDLCWLGFPTKQR